MSNEHDDAPDEWELKLEDKLVELKECQTNSNVQTCTDCDKFFECDLRKSYVVAVYESMNKGSGGGFEF